MIQKTKQDKGRRRRKDNYQIIAQLEERLHSQLVLSQQTELQQQLSSEREKVLCDQLIHQQFMYDLLASATLQDTAAPAPATLLAPQSRQQQSHPKPSHTQLPQQQQVPSSYVARLLHSATQQQVQQVLSMTAQDWLHFFADLFPRLSLLVELCQRCEYQSQQEDDMAMPAFPASTCTRPAATDCDRGSSDLLSAWFGKQLPLGFNPEADHLTLQRAVDEATRVVMLGYVFNHVPLLEACMSSYNPGRRLRAQPAHWKHVASRLGLTATQELHMSICLTEYKRMGRSSRADANSLLQSTATPSLLVAAAEQERLQHRQPSPQTQGQVPHAAAATAACEGAACSDHTSGASSNATGYGAQLSDNSLQQQEELQDRDEESSLREIGDHGQDHLQQQLQQYVQRRHVHLLSAATFFVNTLSQYQLAQLICASYPFVPSFTGVAEVITERLQQRQQQRRAALAASTQQPAEAAATPAAAADGDDAKGRDAGTNGCRTADGAAGYNSNKTSSSGSYLQRMLEQHQQARAAELELHRQLCWSEVRALH